MKTNVTKTIKVFMLLNAILLSIIFSGQQKKDKDYVGHVTLLRKNGLGEKVMLPEFKIYSIEIKCLRTKNNYGKKQVIVKSDAGTKTYWNNIVLEIKDNAGNIIGNWQNINSNFTTPPLNLSEGQNVSIALKDGLNTGYAGNGNPFIKLVPSCAITLSAPVKADIKNMKEMKTN